MANLIDGKLISTQIKDELKEEVAELKKKDEVTVVESEQNWKKVRTADGVIGYVKNKTLKNEEKKNITRKFEEQDYSDIS